MGKMKEIDIELQDVKNIILSLCILFSVIITISLIAMQKELQNMKYEKEYWINQYNIIEKDYKEIVKVNEELKK